MRFSCIKTGLVIHKHLPASRRSAAGFDVQDRQPPHFSYPRLCLKSQDLLLEEVSTTCGSGWVRSRHASMWSVLTVRSVDLRRDSAASHGWRTHPLPQVVLTSSKLNCGLLRQISCPPEINCCVLDSPHLLFGRFPCKVVVTQHRPVLPRPLDCGAAPQLAIMGLEALLPDGFDARELNPLAWLA